MSIPNARAKLLEAQAAITAALTELPVDPIALPGDLTRRVFPPPPAPALGPAGTWVTDPVFQTRILRVTDPTLSLELDGRSVCTQSSTAQRSWSLDSQYFVLQSVDGACWVFHWDGERVTSIGRVPKMFGPMEWSPIFPNYAYGATDQWTDTHQGNHHTIGRFNLVSGQTDVWLDVADIFPELGNPSLDTYLAGVFTGGGKVITLCGGEGQNYHYLVPVIDERTGKTLATLNSKDRLGCLLHSVQIDDTGRFVFPTPTSREGGQPANYVWDLDKDTIERLDISGHTALLDGRVINQNGDVDAYQWDIRRLDALNSERALIDPLVEPRTSDGAADHPSWRHPDWFVSGTYRRNMNVAWRPWDNEIIIVPTVEGHKPVRRICHTHAVALDGTSSWAKPRPSVAPDGSACLFTSSWDDTLGIDPHDGDTPNCPRRDTFLVKLV